MSRKTKKTALKAQIIVDEAESDEPPAKLARTVENNNVPKGKRGRTPAAAVVTKAPAEPIEPVPVSVPVTIPRHPSSLLEIVKPPTASGIVLACGQNDVGQLGLGEDVSEKKTPFLVPNVIGAVDVCTGGMHSLVLVNDGSVYSFGCNDEGALGQHSTEDGYEYKPNKINLPGVVVKLSAGDSHSACLLEDGRVYAWGSFRDSHGSMGLTMDGSSPSPIHILPHLTFVDIASGTDHLCLLTPHGKLYTVGCAEQGQLGRVSSRSASGESRRGKSELIKPVMVTLRSNIDAIWATAYCTFVRERKSQNIYAFGLNNYNQLVMDGNGTFFNPKLTPLKDVISITGGQHHTLILKNDNKCYVIGRKDYGRLGLGTVKDDVSVLTLVKALADKHIVSIACGDTCSFAITKDGKLYVWGIGSNNQLGIGTETDIYVPTLATGKQIKDRNVLKVASGGQHTLFIVSEDKPANGDMAVTITTDDIPKTESIKAPKVNGVGKKKAQKEK